MISCKLCIEPISFPSEADAKIHFIKCHGSNKCQLCNRKGSAKASNFCHTCKSAFLPDINNIEGLENEIATGQRKLRALEYQKRSKMNALKTRFITQYKDLFCKHDLPKTENCEKCNKFYAQEVKPSPKFIPIDISDF